MSRKKEDRENRLDGKFSAGYQSNNIKLFLKLVKAARSTASTTSFKIVSNVNGESVSDERKIS